MIGCGWNRDQPHLSDLEALPAMADAAQRSAAAFLKDGAFLPARRCRLFLELFTLSAVLSVALYLFKRLALAGAAADADIESYFLSPHDMDIGGVSHFIATWRPSDYRRLFAPVHLVAGIAVGSATYIATVSAAVMARSDSGGEQQKHHTLPSFLRKVKSNLARPAKILLLSSVLRVALLLLIGEALEMHPTVRYPARHLYLLLEFVCSVTVVASVAEEPGKGTALWRACRLMQRKYYSQYVLYLAGVLVTRISILLVCVLVVAMVGSPPAGGVVDASFTFLLLSAKEVLSVGNVTGYYFACRERDEQEKNAAARILIRETTSRKSLLRFYLCKFVTFLPW
ncbi:hypothetical protein ACQJBY_007355 [Aegilops geniculata]